MIYGDPGDSEGAPGRAGAPPPRLDGRFTNLNLEKVKKKVTVLSAETHRRKTKGVLNLN